MPPSVGSEQRAIPRAGVAVDLQLARKVGRPLRVRTLDLNHAGARVASARPLRVDEELHFDVDLPSRGLHLDGTARVLRQDRHNIYALRFEHLPPATVAELRSFVEAFSGARMHYVSRGRPPSRRRPRARARRCGRPHRRPAAWSRRSAHAGELEPRRDELVVDCRPRRAARRRRAARAMSWRNSACSERNIAPPVPALTMNTRRPLSAASSLSPKRSGHAGYDAAKRVDALEARAAGQLGERRRRPRACWRSRGRAPRRPPPRGRAAARASRRRTSRGGSAPGSAYELRAAASDANEQRWSSSRSLSAMNAICSSSS